MVSANLHVHSEYSFLGSLLTVENITGLSSFYGFKACCLTDTLSTFGFYKLNKLCRKDGLKPVYGLELFVRGISGRGHYPVLLFAGSNAGLENLFSLNTLAHRYHGESGHFTLPVEALEFARRRAPDAQRQDRRGAEHGRRGPARPRRRREGTRIRSSSRSYYCLGSRCRISSR